MVGLVQQLADPLPAAEPLDDRVPRGHDPSPAGAMLYQMLLAQLPAVVRLHLPQERQHLFVGPLAPAAALLVGVVVLAAELGARFARVAGFAGFEPVIDDQIAPALVLAVLLAAQLR